MKEIENEWHPSHLPPSSFHLWMKKEKNKTDTLLHTLPYFDLMSICYRFLWFLKSFFFSFFNFLDVIAFETSVVISESLLCLEIFSLALLESFLRFFHFSWSKNFFFSIVLYQSRFKSRQEKQQMGKQGQTLDFIHETFLN